VLTYLTHPSYYRVGAIYSLTQAPWGRKLADLE
jgi:hypothetical protein